MREFLRKVNQSNLLFDILLVLGVFLIALSLANYFGNPIRTVGFIVGWFGFILLLFAIKVMELYLFRKDQLDFDHKIILRFFPGLKTDESVQPLQKGYAGLIILLILIAGWAIIQFVLLQMEILSNADLLWLLMIAVFAMLLGMPGIHLGNAGYTELIYSTLIFGLLPIYAYLVICGEFHILMLLMCMPIALFYLALRLLVSLSRFSKDQKNGRINLLQKTGWKQGMFFHNIFILSGFVIFACIPLFGFSVKIFLYPLIVLPIGLVLVFMLYRIEHGKKPEWSSLIFLEKILISMVFYLLLSAMILRL